MALEIHYAGRTQKRLYNVIYGCARTSLTMDEARTKGAHNEYRSASLKTAS